MVIADRAHWAIEILLAAWSEVGSITDQGRPTIKHRFLVCFTLNNRRNLLQRRGCPPCATFGREHWWRPYTTCAARRHM